MSNDNYNHNLIVGAAVVTGVLGTLCAIACNQRPAKGWTEKAKDAATHVLEGEMVNKNLMLGGIAGGLIGALTALLLAPKAGTELMKDLVHPFSHQGERKRSTSRRSSSSGSRKSSARKRGSSHSAKKRAASHGAAHHAAAHTEEKKPHKRSARRKSTAGRKTATAALKNTAAVSEKAADEVTGA